MKTPQIKNASFNGGKLSLNKVARNAAIIVGGLIIICSLIIIFHPDPLINYFLKDRITKAISETYPEYQIQLGDIHYSVFTNRLVCDSIKLKTPEPVIEYRLTSFSVSGINWLKILWQNSFNLKNLANAEIDAQNIILNSHKSQDELRVRMVHISIPDSEMVTDSIKYYSLNGDEKLFSKSEFRQTRIRLDIPQMKIAGLDFLALLQGKIYKARSVSIHDMFADILVNMDKPYDTNSPNPEMPNEVLSSMKEIVKIDSLEIIGGRLKYSERYAVGSTPGIITFTKVNVSVKNITNNKTIPDTAVINAQGIFMNSAIMKLHMAILLASKDFSLRYSGSLGKMDATILNSFIEAGEHQRIKSGNVESAAFNINVNSGRASGSLRVLYSDLSVAILNNYTGSEKGILNKIASYVGKTFIIRESNLPDENGLLKIGEINYTRNPDDYFLQFVWFALRSGVGDVVGF